jgi:PAS domain S-box-containing protein
MARSQPKERQGRHNPRRGARRTAVAPTVRESAEVYRALFDHALDAMVVVDSAGVITTVNQQAEQLLGWAVAELSGQPYQTVVAPATARVAEDRRQRVLAGESLSTPVATELVHKDGHVVPVEACLRVLRTQDGHLIGCAEIYRPRTERQQAAAELQEPEVYYRTVLEQAADLLVVLQADGTLSYRSPSCARILGCPAELSAGSNGFAFVHPDDEPQARKQWTDLVTTPRATAVLTLRLRHADGSWKCVEARATNLLHALPVAGVVITVRALSEPLPAEAAGQDAGRLQALVAETLPDVVGVYNIPRDTVEYVNPRVLEVLGYAAQEFLGQGRARLQQFVPEEERPQVARWYAEVAGSLETDLVEVEHGVLHRNGEIRWLASRAIVCHKTRDGHPEQILVVGQDITRRKRLEQLLRTQTIESKDMPERLRKFRESLRLTQPEFGRLFAGASGPFNARQISSYETGDAVIPTELLLAMHAKGYPLAGVLGATPPGVVEKTVGYFANKQAELEMICRLLDVVVRSAHRERATIAACLDELRLPGQRLPQSQEKVLAALLELQKQHE